MSTTDAPGVDPVSLGFLTFNSVEAPSELAIGAFAADIVVSKRVGNGQHTANMGVHPKPVTFIGRFVQPGVDSGMEALTVLIVSRREVPFTWRTYRYYCQVKDVTPKFRNANYCDFSVDLVITRATNASITPAAPTSADDQISDLINNAMGQNQSVVIVDPEGSSTFQQVLSTATTAVSTMGPIARLQSTQIATIVQAVLAASSAVLTYQQGLEEGDPQYVIAGQLVTSLSLVAQYLKSGQNVNTVRVQGASYMEIAALFYGDVTLFSQLQSANNSISPFTSSWVYTDVGLPTLQSTS